MEMTETQVTPPITLVLVTWRTRKTLHVTQGFYDSHEHITM